MHPPSSECLAKSFCFSWDWPCFVGVWCVHELRHLRDAVSLLAGFCIVPLASKNDRTTACCKMLRQEFRKWIPFISYRIRGNILPWHVVARIGHSTLKPSAMMPSPSAARFRRLPSISSTAYACRDGHCLSAASHSDDLGLTALRRGTLKDEVSPSWNSGTSPNLC